MAGEFDRELPSKKLSWLPSPKKWGEFILATIQAFIQSSVYENAARSGERAAMLFIEQMMRLLSKTRRSGSFST
jgi:hypothetical protein